MYTGKEPCQGCGKQGTEAQREQKDKLCFSCKEIYNSGLTSIKEQQTEYTVVRDWVNGFASFGWDEYELDSFVNGLMRHLDNKTAKTEGVGYNTIRAQHLGSVRYKIPKEIAEIALPFFEKLNNEVKGIKQKKEILKLDAKNAVSAEKDRIYNEGINKGRQLLVGLNTGEVSMGDFEKNYSYNPETAG